MKVLYLDEFYEVNKDEIHCIFAETGADRELDFNLEREIEKLWESSSKYPQLKRYIKHKLPNTIIVTNTKTLLSKHIDVSKYTQKQKAYTCKFYKNAGYKINTQEQNYE